MAVSERLGGSAAARERLAQRARRRFGVKRYLPRTLFGRSLLILVIPGLLLQAIAAFYFYREHLEHMTSRLSFAVAGEIAMVIEELERLDDEPEARRELFQRAGSTMQLAFTFEPGETLSPRPRTFGDWILERELTWAVRGRIGRPFAVAPLVLEDWTEVQVQLADGVLNVLVPRDRLFSSSSTNFMIIMVASGIALLAVALVFMRNQIRPIRRLAQAADSFGKGRDVPNFRPEGAAEVRQAARAFLVMRDRLQRQIAQRTDMLAGVSHDLRTPLTRMKLELEMLGDGPDVADLKADVVDMERMVQGYLAFASGDMPEEAVATDLAALAEEAVVAARRSGAEAGFRAEGPLVVPLRPQAVRRCLDNLLSNAQRHAGRIWVTCAREGGDAALIVDDDGPGIPEEELDAVFRPFYRIERSRNPQTGGTGLGLTIARDVARHHGGDLVLERAPRGGLRCVLRLPG
jgi:two-component system osmolarity sensor histidine kinase EnvZ